MSTCKPAGARHFITGLIVALSMIGVAGCGQSAPEPSGAKIATASSEATPAVSKQAEDRGNARFTTGGTTWNGTYASARLKDTRLKISASKTEREGDKMKRDSLGLNISDYKGPGRYKTGAMSMFVRVSIDLPKNSGEPIDAQKTMTDALGGASNISMSNLEIEITSDSDGYIDGTFSIDRPESPISDGKFHARIRE